MKMRRIGIAAAGLAAIVAGASLATCMVPALAAAPASKPAGAIARPEPASPFVAIDIWVKAGSQDDPPGKEGLCALTARVIAEGSTRRRSYDEILARLYPMAANYGYSVDKEMTVFRGRVHRDNLAGYYDLLGSAVLEPAFDPKDFERIKSQVMNALERGRRYGQDEELAKEVLFAEVYAGTPYAHPEEGLVSSVRALTLDDVKSFYAAWYRRGNVVVAVGGGYPDGFVERARADFDRLPAGEVKHPPRPAPARPHGIKVVIVEKETDATAISIGHPIDVVRGDPDFFPLMAMNSWLGEHRNGFSHLYQVIRAARGMNYGDYSYIEAWPEGHESGRPPTNVARRSQIFQLWIRPVSRQGETDLHDRAIFATRAALRELARLVDSGMTAEELESARGFLRDYTVGYGETVSRRLEYAVDDAFYGIGGDGFLAAIRPALAKLTLEEVNLAIQRHLRYRDLWIVLVTADAEGMKAKLVAGAASPPMRYAGEKPAALLEEDARIAAFPLAVKAEDVTIIPVDRVFE